MKKEQMVELVEFCDGNVKKIDEWINKKSNLKIKTIEDLTNLPEKFRKDYSLLTEKEAPEFRKYFIDYMFVEYGCYEKMETIYLDNVLDVIYENNEIKPETVKLIEQELINLKFNSMKFDW